MVVDGDIAWRNVEKVERRIEIPVIYLDFSHVFNNLAS
jgi:hypothetical protein